MTLFYLTERPEEARWLRADEREWLAGGLGTAREARTTPGPAWHPLGNPRGWRVSAALFLGLTATYGISLWMPKIVEKLSSFGVSKVSLIASIPYFVALPVMWLAGWSSDRTGERKWHAAIPRIVAGTALAVCIYT